LNVLILPRSLLGLVGGVMAWWNDDYASQYICAKSVAALGSDQDFFGVRIRTCTASLLHALDKNDRRVVDKIRPGLAIGVARYIGAKVWIAPGKLVESGGFESKLVGFDTQVIVCNGKGFVIQKENVIHRSSLIQWSVRSFNETVFARRSEMIFLVQGVVVHGDEAAPRL